MGGGGISDRLEGGANRKWCTQRGAGRDSPGRRQRVEIRRAGDCKRSKGPVQRPRGRRGSGRGRGRGAPQLGLLQVEVVLLLLPRLEVLGLLLPLQHLQLLLPHGLLPLPLQPQLLHLQAHGEGGVLRAGLPRTLRGHGGPWGPEWDYSPGLAPALDADRPGKPEASDGPQGRGASLCWRHGSQEQPRPLCPPPTPPAEGGV